MLDRKPEDYVADYYDFCKDMNLDAENEESIKTYINEYVRWHVMFRGINQITSNAYDVEEILKNRNKYEIEESKSKLTESHMDDYSAENKYKVTYIDGEGKEKEIEYTPSKNTNIAGVQKELGKQNKDYFKLKSINKLEESKKIEEGNIRAMTYAERFIQEILSTVSGDYTLDNVLCETTPGGNVRLITKDGKDICTVAGRKFSDDMKDDLRENGYWNEPDFLDEEELVEKAPLTESTNLSANDENNIVVVNKNQFGYNTIAIIIDKANKRFQLVSGQTLPTGKYRKASKKAIRQKAEDLLKDGYTEIRGSHSLAESKNGNQELADYYNKLADHHKEVAETSGDTIKADMAKDAEEHCRHKALVEGINEEGKSLEDFIQDLVDNFDDIDTSDLQGIVMARCMQTSEDEDEILDEIYARVKKLNEGVEEDLVEKEDEPVEETQEEIVERAIEEEGDAIDTYDELLDKVEDEDLEEMVKEIQKDEEEHEELLQHYAETGEALSDEELTEEPKEEIVEESKKLEEDDSFYNEISVENFRTSGQKDGLLATMTLVTKFGNLDISLLLDEGEFKITAGMLADRELINKIVDEYDLQGVTDFAADYYIHNKYLDESKKVEEAKSREDYEEELYYLQDRAYDYERHGRGSEEEYEEILDKIEQIRDQMEYLDESKKVEEDVDDTVTEYVITFMDMTDDLDFTNQEEADAEFERLVREGKADNIRQYFRKDWDLLDGDYVEGYTEIFFNNGDPIQEDFFSAPEEVKQDSIEKGLYCEDKNLDSLKKKVANYQADRMAKAMDNKNMAERNGYYQSIYNSLNDVKGVDVILKDFEGIDPSELRGLDDKVYKNCIELRKQLEEGYSLGDDKESFDVFEETCKYVDEVEKALKDKGMPVVTKGGDKVGIYLEPSQDSVTDFLVMIKGLEINEDVQRALRIITRDLGYEYNNGENYFYGYVTKRIKPEQVASKIWIYLDRHYNK